MMAWTSAIRFTPIARVIVTAAGRPSGMALTARATAAMNISRAVCPTNHPAKNMAAETARMTTRSTRLKWAIFLVRGVEISTASAMRPEMRPVSVRSPVAMTMPRPWPKVTSVPA